jgi:hypothetical protein
VGLFWCMKWRFSRRHRDSGIFEAIRLWDRINEFVNIIPVLSVFLISYIESFWGFHERAPMIKYLLQTPNMVCVEAGLSAWSEVSFSSVGYTSFSF